MTTFSESAFPLAAGLVAETGLQAVGSAVTAVAGVTALNIANSFAQTGEAPSHPLGGTGTAAAIAVFAGPTGDGLATGLAGAVRNGVAGVSPATAPATHEITERAAELGAATAAEFVFERA